MYRCHHALRKLGNIIVTETLIEELKMWFDLCSVKLAKDQTLRTPAVCVTTEKLGDPPTLRCACHQGQFYSPQLPFACPYLKVLDNSGK